MALACSSEIGIPVSFRCDFVSDELDYTKADGDVNI